MAEQLLSALADQGVTGGVARCVDYDIKPGVEADVGGGDQWPGLRERVRAADILVPATPTWMGHVSSADQRGLERLDAELSETDDAGRPVLAGKVAIVAVVGNEDGAHEIVADVFQGLNDVGYTIPRRAARTGTDPRCRTPTQRNAAHLARMLRSSQHPPDQAGG
jgi:multimeric flavodoxin WrbA